VSANVNLIADFLDHQATTILIPKTSEAASITISRKWCKALMYLIGVKSEKEPFVGTSPDNSLYDRSLQKVVPIVIITITDQHVTNSK
jgi:hypothetical protein